MTPQASSPSGPWLKRIAQLFFDEDTLTRVVLPTLADLEHEVQEAGGDVRAIRSARLRGYVAFWKLVVLSPFLFAQWPSRSQFALSLTHVVAIVVLLVVTLEASSVWMMRLLAEWLPPGILERLFSVADMGPYVWLLTPIALIALAIVGRRSPFRAPMAVVLICGATIAAAVTYGAIGFAAVFAGIAESGSAGLGSVIPAVDALAIPTLLALAIAFIATSAAGISQWRFRDRLASAAPSPASSPTAAIVLTISIAVSLFAANQWLVMNEELLDVALDMTIRPPGPGGMRAAVSRSEIAIPLMVLGFVIATATLVAALAAWRGSQTRAPNALLRWTTRLAIVFVLAACAWHANVIGGQWQEFRAETSAARAAPR